MTSSDYIARRAAARLTDLDPNLPAQVEQNLALDPLAQPAMRLVDPISLAALLVSAAALAWQIYHDLKQDHAAAHLDKPAKTDRLAAMLHEDPDLAARYPAALTVEQRTLIVYVLAAETVASDTDGS